MEQLRANASQWDVEPLSDPASHLLQLRQLTAAYESLSAKEPVLPQPDSPLPSLLALRITFQTAQASKAELAATTQRLEQLEQRVAQEQADLDSAKLIQTTLTARITFLETAIQERTQKPPSQVAKDMLQELKRRKEKYDKDTGRLVKQFNKFIDKHLAAMLAAEELGGPVVGQLLDVDQDDFETGFSASGKGKHRKDGQGDGKRQRRIDDIWGAQRNEQGEERETFDEKTAAAGEMRELTEELLNSLVEAGSGRGDGYVQLKRESAAARFLVRSKVAQFHPRDARKLKLIDFGRDLDD